VALDAPRRVGIGGAVFSENPPGRLPAVNTPEPPVMIRQRIFGLFCRGIDGVAHRRGTCPWVMAFFFFRPPQRDHPRRRRRRWTIRWPGMMRSLRRDKRQALPLASLQDIPYIIRAALQSRPRPVSTVAD